MATDSNWFDDWLKRRLHRDIIFRILVWSSIASATAYFASRETGFSGIGYLANASKSLLPVLNLIGSAAIMLSLVAMMFKDAEHVGGVKWSKSSSLGRFGGIVRRLAGDLTLWVVGSLVALLSAVTVVLVQAVNIGAMTSRNASAIAVMYFVFGIFLIVTAILNVYVRRAKPPLTASIPFSLFLHTPWRVVPVYVLAIGFIAYRVWLTRQG
ncbi:hypothetical protein [Lysobacter sp. CFH 32150]|uniref:hypothetical protein n=1 Tax=Lysobacter sp. CFH 32150 TaxID=2927128 RepID=UPI001FA77D77|nr:hypothetical protein [Lysobacter sp. CFH 32150]MCI4569491.1 hypothetical protein [Lysobacter sp. CFH 32150]